MRGEKVDARTDVFSLGVMLYEMIADYAPFVGATLREVIAANLRDEPPSLAACALEMPLEFERIVRQSLCKDRAARYQTAQELFVDLQQLKKRLEFKAEVRRESRVQQGMFSEAVAEWQRAMTFAGDHELGTILSSAYAEPILLLLTPLRARESNGWARSGSTNFSLSKSIIFKPHNKLKFVGLGLIQGHWPTGMFFVTRTFYRID